MKSKRKKTLVMTGFTAFLLLMLGFAVFFYFNFDNAVVSGESMEPTLKNGRRLLYTKAYWLVGPLRKDDIVVMIDPTDETRTIIKRIAGLGGDTIDPLNVPEDYSLTRGPYTVPEGEIYVLGDNAEVSEDSRLFGSRPLKEVMGKVVIMRGVEPSPETENSVATSNK